MNHEMAPAPSVKRSHRKKSKPHRHNRQPPRNHATNQIPISSNMTEEEKWTAIERAVEDLNVHQADIESPAGEKDQERYITSTNKLTNNGYIDLLGLKSLEDLHHLNSIIYYVLKNFFGDIEDPLQPVSFSPKAERLIKAMCKKMGIAPRKKEDGYTAAPWNRCLRSTLYCLASKLKNKSFKPKRPKAKASSRLSAHDNKFNPTEKKIKVPMFKVLGDHCNGVKLLLRCPLTQLFSDDEEPGFGLVNLKHEAVIRQIITNLGQDANANFVLEALELSFPGDDLDGACSVHPHSDRLSQFASIMCFAGQKVITLRVARRARPY